MKYGYTINNKLMANSDGKLLSVDPYNPLNLPPNTIRVRTNDGQPPVNGFYDSATLVEGTTDVYDVYKGNDFYATFGDSTNVIEVLGANSEGITGARSMFNGCTALSSVPSFDTSKVTDMEQMFEDCTSLTTAPYLDTSNVRDMFQTFKDCVSLTSVPLYDTSKIDAGVVGLMNTFANCKSLISVPLFDTSNIEFMFSTFKNCSSLSAIPLFNTSKLKAIDAVFENCVNVQSGALALYQQASSQTNVPGHTNTFSNCGINTQTGSAELAQIPDDWK